MRRTELIFAEAPISFLSEIFAGCKTRFAYVAECLIALTMAQSKIQNNFTTKITIFPVLRTKDKNNQPHHSLSTVCFFVYVIDTGHGSTGSGTVTDWALPDYSGLHPYSDAGYADLPLTLLGAPVSIGEASGGRMA